jgi:hypothetical protein
MGMIILQHSLVHLGMGMSKEQYVDFWDFFQKLYGR